MNVESVDVVLNIDNSSSGLYHFITLDVDLDNTEKLHAKTYYATPTALVIVS